jgi:hypothetical protein
MMTWYFLKLVYVSVGGLFTSALFYIGALGAGSWECRKMGAVVGGREREYWLGAGAGSRELKSWLRAGVLEAGSR